MSTLRERKLVKEQTEHEEPGYTKMPTSQNSYPSYCYWLMLTFKVTAFIFLILPLLCLLVLVVLIEAPIEPVTSEYRLPERPVLEGILAPNDILVSRADRLFEGQLIGPDSIVVQSEYLYTGTADGRILQLDLENETLRNIATIKRNYGHLIDGECCGRPLGMRFDRNGSLIVLDAFLGMYKINITSGDVFQLFPSSWKVDGKEFKHLNGLDIADDGTIYFTHSSHFTAKDFVLADLEGTASGRLLKYNPVHNTTEVLLKNVYFANGVCLSEDNSYVLVSESVKSKIQKYYLTGPKQGQSEIFIENLPGIPDDITRSSRGGYWVALGRCRDASRFSFIDTMQHYPWIRKQLSKVPHLISKFGRRCGLILELDTHGNIIRSLHDPNGEKLFLISTVNEVDGYLYTGSFVAQFVGRVNISNI